MSARLLLGILVAVLIALRVLQRALSRRRARAAGGGGARCPSCGAPRLVITDRLSLAGAGGAPFDLEALACRRCDLRAVGVRDAGHRGYPIDALTWGALSASLRQCPVPADRGCACAAHERYRDGGAAAVPRDEGACFLIEEDGADDQAPARISSRRFR